MSASAGDSVWSAIAAGRADDRDAFVDLGTGDSLSFADPGGPGRLGRRRARAARAPAG